MKKLGHRALLLGASFLALTLTVLAPALHGRTPRGTPVPVTVSHKFNAGYYAVAGQAGVGGGGTGTYVDTSVTPPVTYTVNTNLAVALNTEWPGNTAAIKGFFTSLHATALETAGQGQYSFDGSASDPILNAYLAIEGFCRTQNGVAKGDSCRFGFMIGWAQNTGGSNNTNVNIPSYTFSGSSGVVPPYVRDCTSLGHTQTNYLGSGKTVGYADLYDSVGATLHASAATTWVPAGSTTRYYFGIQPGAAGQCGHAYGGFSSSNYVVVAPTMWEPGTIKVQKNLITALYSKYKLPYTDASGNTTWYTLDQHPLFELMWDADETSVNFGVSAGNIYPVSTDANNYPAGGNLSATGYWAGYLDLLSAVNAVAVHTEFGIATNFRFLAGKGDDDTNTVYNTRLPFIAANYPSIALNGPDTYGNSWGSAPQATTAQQAFVGIASPSNTSLGAIVPAASLQATMDAWGQIQDLDHNNHIVSGHGNYTAATEADIYASGNGHANSPGQYTLGATRWIVWDTTDRFLTSDWRTLIYPGIVAASSATPVNAARPSNWP